VIAVKNLLLIGDSKFAETSTGSYQPRLCAGISTINLWRERPTRIAVAGRTVATTQDNIDAAIAAAVGTPDAILINLGANDADDALVEATFKADFAYILDALHAAYPNAIIYVTKVWRQGFDAECLMIWEWMLDVMSTRAYCVAGIDEVIALKGSDNGATNTEDGIHPNDAGVEASVALWAALVS
jgi:lysophospholipase L1-like esterase